jgi:hypothetical protein
MLKKFKILSCITLIVLLAGCGNKALNQSYDKMQITKNKIIGYNLDLRIYGIYNKKKVNENIRITNYKNTLYHIEIIKPKQQPLNNDNKNKLDFLNLNDSNEHIYIKNKTIYKVDENGNLYKTTDKNITYSNPAIYLEGIKNIASNSKEEKVKIGTNNYTHYIVKFKKNIINEILDDTALKDITVKENVDGEIYLDNNNFVYRIIYKFDNITINANYYSINTVKPIAILSSL